MKRIFTIEEFENWCECLDNKRIIVKTPSKFTKEFKIDFAILEDYKDSLRLIYSIYVNNCLQDIKEKINKINKDNRQSKNIISNIYWE